MRYWENIKHLIGYLCLECLTLSSGAELYLILRDNLVENILNFLKQICSIDFWMLIKWIGVVIHCNTRGCLSMIISLRLSVEDAKLNKDYAKVNNISVSDLIRQAVIKKIEEEIDLVIKVT